MALYDFESISSVLNFELEARKIKNTRFSLRSFANLLDIAPSNLSIILKGKKGISEKKARYIAHALGYDRKRSEWFVNLTLKDFGKSKSERDIALSNLINCGQLLPFQRVSVSELKFEFTWVHIAIRNITDFEDFEFSKNWIAKKLGIKTSMAERAMRDLLDNQLVTLDKNGKLTVNHRSFYWEGVSGKKKRDIFHSELNKVLEQKSEGNEKSKIHNSTKYISISSSKLMAIKNLIIQLDNKIDDFSYETPQHDSLLCLKIEAYRLEEIDPSL